jgi:hypothetical protein
LARGLERKGDKSGESGEGRNRTGDTMIFSHVLYRLSYLAARRQAGAFCMVAVAG